MEEEVQTNREEPREQPIQQSEGGGKPVWFWVVVVLLLAVLLGGGVYAWQNPQVMQMFSTAGNGGGSQNGVVATVNGEEITGAELSERVEQTRSSQLGGQSLSSDQEGQLREQTLETLINETLIQQAAEEAGITVSDEEINQSLEQVKGQFENEQQFQQQLENNDVTESDLRNRIQRQLLIQKYVQQNTDMDSINVTDEEVQQMYDQLSQQQDNVPALEEIRSQVESQVRQQKSSQLLQELVQQLRDEADVSTSL